MADWLLEELQAIDDSPAGGGSGHMTDEMPEGARPPGYRFVGRILAQELMVRRTQAAQMRTVAEAVALIEPARRSGRSHARRAGDRTARAAASDPLHDPATGTGAHRDHEDDTGRPEHGEDEDGTKVRRSKISAEQLLSARLAPELNLHPLTAAVEVGVAVGLVRDLPLIMGL
ncbi:hypothetical protein, partial [Kineosporia sp. NBRC 101731]|uniref:hypothetical protein n=1 Tax=Kineosporia sp. NBRC 101731 TaxID=3032199 RepID=UPI0025558996